MIDMFASKNPVQARAVQLATMQAIALALQVPHGHTTFLMDFAFYLFVSPDYRLLSPDLQEWAQANSSTDLSV